MELGLLHHVFGEVVSAIVAKTWMENHSQQPPSPFHKRFQVHKECLAFQQPVLIQTPNVSGLMLYHQEHIGLTRHGTKPNWMLERIFFNVKRMERDRGGDGFNAPGHSMFGRPGTLR